MTNRYTIFGNPIEHSLSPQIHHQFGVLTERSLQYTRTLASEDTFTDSVRAFQQSGGVGCNVTSPFKELAAALCDVMADSAKLAEAVNTIRMADDGTLHGHNTDGSGLLVDIQHNRGFSLGGKRVLLLGAGGAARGVVAPLLSGNPELLCIANRTRARADKLADIFSSLGNVSSCGFDELAGQVAFDLVINATSMGFQGDAPPLPAGIFSSDSLAYDMMYSKQATPFMLWCDANGATSSCDGLGMLVEQAADAFSIWEGVRPATESVLVQLAQQFKPDE